jgi:hypothetical protein
MTNIDDTKQTATHTPEPWVREGTTIYTLEHHAWHKGEQRLRNRFTVSVQGYSETPKEELEANARRICAAVNACKGIDTEALERGVIADLRHILGELLTAASDLDAAIDGTTDQFDAERNRLNAGLRAAQAILDGGMELHLYELLAARGQIALGWSIEDVQEVRPDLTAEQAWEVLQQVERHHDATIGITWNTLETVAEIFFGDAPEADLQD